MGVLDVLLLLYIFFLPGVYKKNHIQSICSGIKRKLKECKEYNDILW